MAYTVKVIHDGKAKNITERVGQLTWCDSSENLGMEFNFSVPFSSFDSQFDKTLSCGDIIVVKSGNKEILRGIITETPINSDSYKGYDFAWYLNKSECVVQFKKIAADKAIRQLCNRYDVPIGSIAKMSTSIKKVYKDVIVSDVINDILKQVKSETGNGHRIEMRNGKMYIVKSGSIKLTPRYTDELGRQVYCTRAAEISGVRTIEELRNEVIVAGNDENSKSIKATAKSSKSINKFGLLTQVETVDNLSNAKAKNKAKNLLASLNKIATSFTAEMPGNDDVRAGRLLYFDRPEVKIKGYYKIKSCTHTVNNGIHRMSCEMERV